MRQRPSCPLPAHPRRDDVAVRRPRACAHVPLECRGRSPAASKCSAINAAFSSADAGSCASIAAAVAGADQRDPTSAATHRRPYGSADAGMHTRPAGELHLIDELGRQGPRPPVRRPARQQSALKREPITAAALSVPLAGSSRSMRAAIAACSVAGTLTSARRADT